MALSGIVTEFQTLSAEMKMKPLFALAAASMEMLCTVKESATFVAMDLLMGADLSQNEC